MFDSKVEFLWLADRVELNRRPHVIWENFEWILWNALSDPFSWEQLCRNMGENNAQGV